MGELALSPEAARLMAARKAAVEELRSLDSKERGIADHDVCRLSNARLLLDGLMLRSLSGEAVGPSELRAANDLVDAARSAACQQSMSISVKFVEGAVGTYVCKHCGERNYLEDGSYVPEPKRSDLPPRTLEHEPVKTSPASVPSAPKAVPERPYHETALRDSRPVPATTVNGNGSLAWFGSQR
jgi:hypothetical protein